MQVLKRKLVHCPTSVNPKPCGQIDFLKQLSNFLTQPHSRQIDALSCQMQLAGPAMASLSKGAQLRNNRLSLPPPKCDLLQVSCHRFRCQPGHVSRVLKQHNLIPITWASHGHTRPHSQALKHNPHGLTQQRAQDELLSTETWAITIFSRLVIIQ